MSKSVSIPDLKRAIEGRDGPTLARFDTDNAVLRVIDRDNLPS